MLFVPTITHRASHLARLVSSKRRRHWSTRSVIITEKGVEAVEELSKAYLCSCTRSGGASRTSFERIVHVLTLWGSVLQGSRYGPSCNSRFSLKTLFQLQRLLTRAWSLQRFPMSLTSFGRKWPGTAQTRRCSFKKSNYGWAHSSSPRHISGSKLKDIIKKSHAAV